MINFTFYVNSMITLSILDEVSRLESVVLGTAYSLGDIPSKENIYDPKSLESLSANIYPQEKDLIDELEDVKKILERYDITVYRPNVLPNYNQVFSRDIALVIEDQLIVPKITQWRKNEVKGIQYIIDQVRYIKNPKQNERMEGGDIILYNDTIFVGYAKEKSFEKYKTSRTNEAGVEFLSKNFKNWKLIPFELIKSDTDSTDNVLHLDCCFQPVGKDKAVICRTGFKNQEEAQSLIDYFGNENIFEMTDEEMHKMNSNFLSISPNCVISDISFHRLNTQLENWNITVEKISYKEVSKMGGLFRCSTMPLKRSYV